MTWFQIIKTDWDYQMHPVKGKGRGFRGKYYQDEDRVMINLPKTVPSFWTKFDKTLNDGEGGRVIDYDKAPNPKYWKGSDLEKETIGNLLDVIIHENGHAGIDKFLEEEGFPEDEKDTFIDKFLKRAKHHLWAEIMAELNEHGGDLPQAIDSARQLDTYSRSEYGAKTEFAKRLARVWNHTQQQIMDVFEQKEELGLLNEYGTWKDLRYPHRGHQHD